MSAFATAMAAAQRQIDGLKVDLAGMQKERDEYFARLGCRTRERDQAIRDAAAMLTARDAALADLSQARAERDNANASFEDAHAACLRTKSQLARALAALRGMLAAYDNNEAYTGPMDAIREARAILADPESTAAVEAYQELTRCLALWDDIYVAGSIPAPNTAAALHEAIGKWNSLTKVDARRAGQGGAK